jgi:hypothetical protein
LDNPIAQVQERSNRLRPSTKPNPHKKSLINSNSASSSTTRSLGPVSSVMAAPQQTGGTSCSSTGTNPGAAASTSASAAPAVIEATSQLSRFHLETLTVTANKALQLQTVNLSVGDKQLLSDAVLSLMAGVRYGLVGR